jgi:hypothetical protein
VLASGWCVDGREPLLNAFDDGVSKVGYSSCVFEVFRKHIDELIALKCSRMAKVQVSRCFELDELRAGICSGAVAVIPNTDG